MKKDTRMDMLTVGEVSKIIKAHTNTVYKMCREGKLPAVKIGKEWRIRRDKLMAFMRDKPVEPPSPSPEPKTADGFNPGHDLVFTATEEDIWDYEADFFKEHAQKGYLLFKGCWWQTPDQFREQLEKRGCPVIRLETQGQIIIKDIASIYEESGPLAVADAWRSSAHLAVKNGFKGLIGTGAPRISSFLSLKDFLTFEQAFDGYLDGLPVKGVCLYCLEDKNEQSIETIIKLMNLHQNVQFRKEQIGVTTKVMKNPLGAFA